MQLPNCSICGKPYKEHKDEYKLWRDLKVQHPQLSRETHKPSHYIICPDCYVTYIKNQHWTKYIKKVEEVYDKK